jgi:hypothetical protein
MKRGYVKLYRKLLENPIFRNAELLQLFLYCLLKANHKKGKAFFGSNEIDIEQGQFVTGRFELSSALGQKESSTYKRLKRLESLHVISLQSNTKNTLVTVENWGLYQSIEEESNNEVTAKEQQSNNKVTTKEQQSNTNKNVRSKECKNEKKEDIYGGFSSNPKLVQVLNDFEQMRKSIKNGKLTDRARELMLIELEKLATTDEKKIAILEQSILNNWKGLFPLKEGGQAPIKKNGFKIDNRPYEKEHGEQFVVTGTVTDEELEKALRERKQAKGAT